MKDTQILTQAIEAGPEAVQKLIESEADRRVNAAVETARQKWETELPGHVETEIQRRNDEHEKQTAARLEIAEAIQARFDGTKIDADTWAEFIDVEKLIGLAPEERNQKIDEQTERVISAIDRTIKQRFSGRTPDATREEDPVAGFKSKLLESMR